MNVSLPVLHFCYGSRKGRMERSVQWQGLLDDKVARVSFVAVNNLAFASKLGMERPNKAAECYDLTKSQYLHENVQEVNTNQSG